MAIPTGCRRCVQCLVVKPLGMFAFKSSGGTQRSGVCMDCRIPPATDGPVWRQCSKKRRYPTPAAATSAAISSAARTPLIRVYECPICNGWHLTHKPERKTA